MMTPFNVMQLVLLRDEERAKEILGLVRTHPGEPIQLYGEYRGSSSVTNSDRSDGPASGTNSGRGTRKRWTFLPALGR